MAAFIVAGAWRPSRPKPSNIASAVGSDGNWTAMFWWKSTSAAKMTVIGAATVLAWLPPISMLTSLSRRSPAGTTTTRSGCWFIDVGPHFTRS